MTMSMLRLSLATSLGVGLSKDVFNWDGSGIANPAPGAAPIVDAEAEAGRSAGSGFWWITSFSDGTRDAANARPSSTQRSSPARICRSTRSGAGAGRASTGLSSKVAVPGDSRREQRKRRCRSRIVDVGPRPGAGGVLT